MASAQPDNVAAANINMAAADNKMAAANNKMAADDVVYDVVVVGAGLAGLTAAHNILKMDPTLKVLVLEARDRVGGRTFNQLLKVRGGKRENFDFGAQWVGRTQHHVLKMIKELDMEIYPQYGTGTKFSQLSGNKVRSYTGSSPTMSSWFAYYEYQFFMWRMDRLSKKVSMEDPYNNDLAYQLESHSVASYGAKYLWTQAARDAVDQSVKAVYGTDASRLGMLFFLAYTSASGGMGQLYGIDNSAQEYRVKFGTQQISNNLADVVGRKRIVLSQAVTAVDQTNQDVILVSHRHTDPVTDLVEGPITITKTRRVIMTVPPNLVRTITWSPRLHTMKQFLCDSLQMGHLYKFIVTYEKSYWREKGYSGELFSNGGIKITSGCTTGPICEVYDTTTFDGAPALIGFFAGRTAIEWTQKTKEERAAAVVNSLANCLGIEELKNFLDYEDKMWMTDPWAGGCPVMYGTPGTLFSMPQIRAPHGRVHFAGTETAIVWMGYMSGAIESGERTAIEAMAALRPELLTEDQHKEARKTRNVREPFFAQPPSTTRCWALTTAVTIGMAFLAGWIFDCNKQESVYFAILSKLKFW